MKYLSLTQSQLGMFLEWNADRTSLQYNLCTDSIFPAGTVDAVRLAAAVRTVLETYPVFRMRLSDRDGEIVQFVDESLAFSVEVCSAKEEEMPQVQASFRRPFDPFVEPMARAEIVVTEAATHLLKDFFHLIYDGTSEEFFFAAVSAAYEGRERPRESMTFADYAALEPSLLAGDAYKTAKEEQTARFAGKTMTVPDGNGQKVEKAGGGGQRDDFSCLIQAKVRMPRTEVEAFCRAKGIHPNLFFMGTFARTLALYANTREAVFYTVNHGRRDPRLRDSLGAFVKTVPVLAELRADRPLVEVLKGLKLHHVGDYPFTHFCRDLNMKPGFGYVFQDGAVRTDFTLDGVPSDTARFSPFGVGRIPTFLVWGDANGFTLDVSVLPGDYSESWCGGFVNRIAEVARRFLAHSDALLRDIPILSGEDEKEILALGVGEKIDYDRTTTFLDLFLEHVKATPDAKAVVAANGTLTYGELDEQSSALAAALVGNGVRPGDFVAVRLGRVKEFPLSVIAIWKAGAAYVPVDPEYPEERIAYMLEDSGAKVVVDEALVAKVGRKKEEGRSGESSTSHFSLLTSHLARPDGLAYMIYTSGSTGKPKGVMVTHANLRAFLAWLPDELGLKPGEAVAEHASFSFDASICDLYTSLSRGVTLHILSSELRKDLDGLAKYLADNRIVGATLSTQLGMELLNVCDLKLRYMVLGGEKLNHVKKTSVRLYNGYGPTEFTCWSSHHVVDQAKDGEDIPIGRAIPNSISAIVDPTGNLLPRGMVGELVLAGEQLSRGYWNRPELTREKFVELPWLKAKAYRTGDLARWNENGELMYCGRIDNQVKLRGFRIEMGEIEAAMAKFPGIAAAVADVKKVNGVDRLVGYYTVVRVTHAHADPGGGGVLVGHEHYGEELRTFLSKSLADYMVPDAFVRLEALPMTPNGKVDRKVLPVPAADAIGGGYVAPATVEERALCAAYGRVLKLARYGAETDFFLAGGSSLDGIRLVAELQRLGFKVVYGDLFKHKTPRNLATFLARVDSSSQTSQTSLTSQTFLPGSYDYAAIDALLAQTPSEPNEGVAAYALKRVLLTGVTGYLGIHVLKQLLESSDCRVAVLVRPKRGLTVEERVASQYFYYFERTLPEAAKDRLSFVEGDITDADLAGKLADVRFDTLFNCAALVKHYVADDLLDRVNVEGVRNLVSVCAAHEARLVQMSTASVGGVAARGTVLDERHLFVGQTTYNDYVRTKYEAERLVLEAIASGRIRGKVMRLGNLMGREADGVFQMNFRANAFINAIRTFARLGAVSLADAALRTEFSQIDLVAEAVVKLSVTPDSMVVFHPFSPYKQDLGSVIDAVNVLGQRIDFVSKSEFASRVEAMRNDPARAKDLQGLLHYGQRGPDDRRPVEAVNDWTTVVLRRLGFLWKPPAEGYLETFFRFLDGLQFFDD